MQNMHLSVPAVEIIARINFFQLETFVWDRFSSFVKKRGTDAVRYDLNYDVQTPTDAFIVNLLETGSVQLLKENGLEQDSRFIDALYLIISAINIVIADFLQKNKIAQVANYRYADADPQYVLLERAVDQVEQRYLNNTRYLFGADYHLFDPAKGSVAC